MSIARIQDTLTSAGSDAVVRIFKAAGVESIDELVVRPDFSWSANEPNSVISLAKLPPTGVTPEQRSATRIGTATRMASPFTPAQATVSPENTDHALRPQREIEDQVPCSRQTKMLFL